MKKISTSKTGFFSILLSLLGLTVSSCGGWLEYGCPEPDYDFKGKVTDENGTFETVSDECFHDETYQLVSGDIENSESADISATDTKSTMKN